MTHLLTRNAASFVMAATAAACARGGQLESISRLPPTADADSLERPHVTGVEGSRLDSLLRALESEGFSGAVLVVRNKKIVLAQGYGFADKERGIANSPATRYELNSITKSFTGAAVLRLAAEGKLGLDDPIERYLGGFPPEKRTATVKHLALHTAGLVVAGTALSGASRDAFVSDLKRVPMETPPGAAYRYTNAGYSALAAVIEAATKRPFDAYLRSEILSRAGLRHALFAHEVPSNDSLFAKGYPPATNPYVWGRIGAAGVWATLGDVYRWVNALESGKVVPDSHLHWLRQPPPAPSQEAFGWHVYAATDTSGLRIEKGGGSDDFATQLIWFPADSLVIVWANNDLSRRWRQRLNGDIVRVLRATTK
jgi:CubicO group peptidase (beta-lactamase class C family)